MLGGAGAAAAARPRLSAELLVLEGGAARGIEQQHAHVLEPIEARMQLDPQLIAGVDDGADAKSARKQAADARRHDVVAGLDLGVGRHVRELR